MTGIRVWAPKAKRVELESDDGRTTMQAENQGWWTTSVSLEHGADYGFLLDGEGPFPDPRSPFQPHGVHGQSRWVDQSRFEWRDAGYQQVPLSSAVIYELHTGTFTPEGTFEAIVDRLDHLLELGITHIELMPVAEFSGQRGWGYDGVALYAPHHAYGGPEGLKRLVNACHQRGMGILLDVVYNHLGPVGNYLGRFAPYFTGHYSTPWGDAVNLDGADSDEVRRFFIDNALMWLSDYHFDGLRIDAVHAIVDTSAIHFLEQLAVEVDVLMARLGRHLVLIAESGLNDPRMIHPRELGGYGIDAQWNDDFHHALHTVLTGERDGYYADFGELEDLSKALTRGFVYDGRYSLHRRRRHGRPAWGVSGRQLIGFLQNHDQVGNRAVGERSSRLLSLGQLKIAAALVLLAPFVPMLFQGEEWGSEMPFLYFTDHDDPEVGEATRRGRQNEFASFGWNPEEIPDPQSEETFLRSKLDWAALDAAPHRELLDWHRSLISLRRRTPDLVDGTLDAVRVEHDTDGRWLILQRGSVLVAVNFANTAQQLALSEHKRTLALSSDTAVRVEDATVSLAPQSVAVLLEA